jgi:hypothetical protein
LSRTSLITYSELWGKVWASPRHALSYVLAYKKRRKGFKLGFYEKVY